MRRTLLPGCNCWRVATAEKLAFLIDGASYFEAFYRAALNAERSITILSWDIDTRTELIPTSHEVDGFPTELGPFLRQLLRRKKGLRVNILNWNFAMLYAMERQWFQSIHSGWRNHHRLRFHLNDRHPIGACQHEKLVVIDDTVAFIGGLDLTKNRWDTPEHKEQEPRRVDPDENGYAPFHDVHTIVAGEVAEAFGELVRLRWLYATGERLPPAHRRPVSEVWPSSVQADLLNLSGGIARTQPKFEDQPAVREIEQLYLDAITAARHRIFIESQYFTAHRVGDAIDSRLSDPQGPEVVIVTRMRSDGWLEYHTMDVLRARLVRRLRTTTNEARLRVLYPTTIYFPDSQCIGVHSKLLIVDDAILTIGSANCSNRSMGLDSECNLIIDGTQSDQVQAGLRNVRHRLLGEHLGRCASEVEQAERRGLSTIDAIGHLNRGPRRLRDCPCDVAPEIEQRVSTAALVDPERPVDSEQFWQIIVRPPRYQSFSRKAALILSAVLVLGGLLGVFWRWSGRRRS
jgi:phospholipase D1/2